MWSAASFCKYIPNYTRNIFVQGIYVFAIFILRFVDIEYGDRHGYCYVQAVISKFFPRTNPLWVIVCYWVRRSFVGLNVYNGSPTSKPEGYSSGVRFLGFPIFPQKSFRLEHIWIMVNFWVMGHLPKQSWHYKTDMNSWSIFAEEIECIPDIRDN